MLGIILAPFPSNSELNPWAELAKASLQVTKGKEVYIPAPFRIPNVVDVLLNRRFKPREAHSCFHQNATWRGNRYINSWRKTRQREDPSGEDCPLVGKAAQYATLVTQIIYSALPVTTYKPAKKTEKTKGQCQEGQRWLSLGRGKLSPLSP